MVQMGLLQSSTDYAVEIAQFRLFELIVMPYPLSKTKWTIPGKQMLPPRKRWIAKMGMSQFVERLS
jgi:hypothetical protein